MKAPIAENIAEAQDALPWVKMFRYKIDFTRFTIPELSVLGSFLEEGKSVRVSHATTEPVVIASNNEGLFWVDQLFSPETGLPDQTVSAIGGFMKDSTVEIVVFEKKKSKLSLQDQDDRLFHQKITEQLLSRGIMPQIKFRQIDIDGPYDFVVGREQGVLHVNTYPSQEADSPSPVQPPQPKSKAQTLMGPSHGTKG